MYGARFLCVLQGNVTSQYKILLQFMSPLSILKKDELKLQKEIV